MVPVSDLSSKNTWQGLCLKMFCQHVFLNYRVNLKEANHVSKKNPMIRLCTDEAWLIPGWFGLHECVPLLEVKIGLLSSFGVMNRPVAYVKSKVLNPISNSNCLVLRVFDIFILRVMKKVAWIVQFMQSQLETPHESIFPVMNIRNENYPQQSQLLLENMKSEII